VSARVEPTPQTLAPDAPREIARAIWGLVDDAYGLAARTPSLTPREAHDLCREADVGDPLTEVEDALAFLHVPRWGYVCARLFTNADRDSSGRAALVSDVVSVAPETFALLRHDPFRCFPPRRADRRPEQRGELGTPALTPMTEDAEAALLARLMEREDAATLLRPLLAALLEGDRVLWLGAPPQAALQALVLLLPVPLRPALTFQTLAVDRPKHAPRLTCAPRRTAELNEQPWSRELPRQAGLIDERALRAADAVLAAAGDRAALTTAHALYDRYAHASAEAGPTAGAFDLLRETERFAGFLALHEAVRRGSPAEAVRTLAADAAPAERALVMDVLVDVFSPARLAADVAGMLRHPDGDHRAAATVVVALARRLRPPDQAFARFFAPLVKQLDGWMPPVTAGADLQRASVVLAVAAAWLADPSALLTWATPDAAWDDAAAAIGRPVLDAAVAPARAPLAALVAAARAPDADAAAGVVESVVRVLPQLSPSARPRAAALALAVVRRAFRERAQVADGGAAAARAADTLLRLWAHEPPDADGAVFRGLLVAAHGGASAGAPRIASAVHAAILTGTAGVDAALGEHELLAWVAVLVYRAASGEPAPASLDQAARLVEHAPRLGRDESARSQQLGRLLLATFPHGAPLSAEWIDFLRYCDPGARRQLLLRALEHAAAAQQGGLVAFTEACAVLADAGVTLDAEAATALRPSLQRVIGALGVSPGAAVRLTGLLAVLGALADADGAAVLVRQLLEKVPNGLQKPLRLRRLASALAEVEQVRDEDAHAELRELFRDVAGGHHLPLPIPAAEERLLRDFLGMPAEPLGARVLSAIGLSKRAPRPAPVPLENNP
jgi:hypothetical protein